MDKYGTSMRVDEETYSLICKIADKTYLKYSSVIKKAIVNLAIKERIIEKPKKNGKDRV